MASVICKITTFYPFSTTLSRIFCPTWKCSEMVKVKHKLLMVAWAVTGVEDLITVSELPVFTSLFTFNYCIPKMGRENKM